jgi:cytochrome d ubiquinol oxidase subunit II
MVQDSSILLGCALAQHPYLVPPELTSAAVPRAVLHLLAEALAAGSLVLFLSLVFLFRVFKGPTLHAER